MNLVEIANREQWEAFVSKLPWAQFTQSWDWGEFQISQGRKARRFFVSEGETPLVASQLIFHPKPLVAGYWLSPRGPVFSPSLSDERRSDALAFLSQELPKILDKAMFIRLEPLLQSSRDVPLGLRAQESHDPACTALIDLTQDEESLLSAMHPKTRYNIGVATRHGVTVRQGVSDDDLKTFLRLNRHTAERNRFTSPSENHIAGIFAAFSGRSLARLRLAEHAGAALAANMEIAYGDTVTYLYGASSSASRQVMAPYLLHWEAIKAAKAEGRKKYDLWGTNPVERANRNYKKSWEGITRFKSGWGGERVDLVGTFDLPLMPSAYRLASFLRRV